MVFIGEPYYNLHRIMLSILGLWPYQKLSILRIQAIFFFSTFLSFLIFQFTIFLTTEYDAEFIFKELTYIFPSLIYFLNYNCFYFNAKIIKKTMEEIKLDWKAIEDNNELKILKEYGYECYLFGLIVNIVSGSAMFIFIIIECIPIILDAAVPLNESRPRKLKVPYELFCDEEEYYLLYLIFEIVTVTVGIWSTITTCTFLVSIGGHTCATFKIASNLIQNTVTENTLEISAPHRTYFMYQNICRAVYIHRRTIQLMGTVLKSVHMWFLPLLLFGVVSSSCIIFRLLNAILKLNDLSELFVSIMLFWGHLMYMFMANYCGQIIINHSAEMLKSTYNTLWYVAPLSIQKLFLLLLSCVKDFKLEVAGIFIPSLEGFNTMMTSAISYFTVIYTMR